LSVHSPARKTNVDTLNTLFEHTTMYANPRREGAGMGAGEVVEEVVVKFFWCSCDFACITRTRFSEGEEEEEEEEQEEEVVEEEEEVVEEEEDGAGLAEWGCVCVCVCV
jgi:hypothetical protein